MGLSSKAMLVCLSISGWTGRKLDKKATNSVETSFSTDKAVGNFSKKLLPGAIELETVTRIADSIRRWYREQTLPWLSDGTRILASQNYLEFMNEFRTRETDYRQSVDNFLSVYPTLRIEASRKLGALFSETDYPSETKLRRAFDFSIVLMPLPEVSDFRTEVLESEKEAFLSTMRNVETEARKECYERLKTVVSKAALRLKESKPIRETLIESIVDVCSLLPKLNVSNDSNLETINREVSEIAAKLSHETLNVNESERQKAASKLAEIESRMAGLMAADSEKE